MDQFQVEKATKLFWAFVFEPDDENAEELKSQLMDIILAARAEELAEEAKGDTDGI